MDAYEDHEETAKSILSVQRDITKSAGEASKGEYKKLDLSRQQEMIEERQADLAYKRSQFESGKSDMSKEELESLERRLELDKKVVSSLELQNKALSDASDSAKKVLGTFDRIMELDIKGAIREGFSFDKIQSEVKEKVGATFVNIAAEMKGEKGLVGGLKAAGAGMKGLLNMAPMFMKALAIGGLLSIVSFIAESFGKVDEEVSKLGQDLGISKHEAIELHHAATDVAGEMGIVGVNAAEVAKGVQTASEIMGGLDIASKFAAGDEKAKQLVKDTTVLSEKFGLSSDEIKNINDLATMSGKSMGQLTAEATTLNKGLMTSKESLKLLSKVPKEVAVGFKGGTQELIKAAAKAKLLGMELKQVQDIGMGMLDIESSLEKEMEARVLTGKNLNLDAARAYALQGDVASLQDELLRQAGSLKEFQAMGPLQQKSMADAMGMTVEQMTTMLTNAEKLKELGIDDAKMKKLQEMNAEELNKELAKGGSQAYKDYVRNLAKEKESEETKKKLADAMTKIQEKLAKMITPLIEMADKFLSVVDSAKLLEPILWTVAGLLGLIATVYIGKKIKDGIGLVKDGFGAIKDGASKLFDYIKGPGSEVMDELADKAGGIAEKVGDKAEDAVSSLTEKAQEAATEKVSEAGEDVASNLADKAKDSVTDKATGLLSDKADDLVSDGADALSSTEAASPKKGGGISEFFEKLDAKKMLQGAAALLVVAAALWVTAKALQEFATVNIEDMGKAGLALLGLTVVLFAISKMKGSLIEGGIALIAMAGALYILGGALQMFENIKLETLGIAAIALVGLTAAVLGLGAIISSGVGGALFAAGIVGFIALGAALVVLGAGLLVVASAIALGSVALQNITKDIEKLTAIDDEKLEGVADKLGILGEAILNFGAGGLMSGIGAGLSAMFGAKSPVEQIMDIMAKLDPSKLDGVSLAIRSLADAFGYFADQIGKMKDFDTDKIDTIIEKMEEVKAAQTGGGGIFGGMFSTQSQTAQPVGIGLTQQGGGKEGAGNPMANVEKKLDTLINVMTQAANTPTVIKFGERVIDEIKTQIDFKSAYNVKVDNTYGRTA
jgi:hypothetical protein